MRARFFQARARIRREESQNLGGTNMVIVIDQEQVGLKREVRLGSGKGNMNRITWGRDQGKGVASDTSTFTGNSTSFK